MTDQPAHQNDNRELARMLAILGEPNRLFLLDSIINGIQCNCELGKSLSLSPNLVSHHLSVLQEAGIINAARDKNDARWIYYSLNEESSERIKELFNIFFDKKRIKPCSSVCGPDGHQENYCKND